MTTPPTPAGGMTGSELQTAITNDRIERLIETSTAQTEASRHLAAATYAEAQSRVEQQERAKLAKRRFRIQIALVIAGFLGLYIRQEYTLSASQDTRDQIVDCVVPTGQCYRDGQARTGQFLELLERESIVRAACAPNYTTVQPLKRRIAAIDACIQRNLH